MSILESRTSGTAQNRRPRFRIERTLGGLAFLEADPNARAAIDYAGNLSDVDIDVGVVRLMLLLGLTIGS